MAFPKNDSYGFSEVRREPPRMKKAQPFYRTVCRDAARCLERKWGKTSAGFLFLTGIWILCSLLRMMIRQTADITGKAFILEGRTLIINLPRICVDGGLILTSALLFSPLLMGYIRFIYQLTIGREAPLMMIFDSLRSVRTLLKSIGSVIAMIAGTVFILALCLLPGGGTLFAAVTFSGAGEKKAALCLTLLLLGGILVLIGMLFAVAILGRFIAVPFILSDEKTGIFSAVALSWRITGQDAGNIFSMFFFFLPLFLSCILLIPAVFVIPYFITSAGLYSRVLLDREIRRRNMESGRTV